MGLQACRECGGQVSSAATNCPKCGAPVPKPSNTKAQLITIAACIGVVSIFSMMSGPSGAPRAGSEDIPHTVAALRERADATLLAKCRSNLESMKAEYVRLLDAKRYWDAKLALEDCPRLLGDETLKAMDSGAAKLSYISTADDTKATPYERLRAISNLKGEQAPAETQRLEPLRIKLQAQLDKTEAADRRKAELAELARRRKEGVSLGMSKDDVLKSSWGRPSSINTTTFTFGVHEQWVYGGGGYLYFEDGKLTSIQN